MKMTGINVKLNSDSEYLITVLCASPKQRHLGLKMQSENSCENGRGMFE